MEREEYMNDSELQEKEKAMLKSIDQSIEGYMKKGAIVITKHSIHNPIEQKQQHNYKYKQYKNELNTGKFEAQESDIGNINLQFDLSPPSSLIRNDHLQERHLTQEQRFKKMMSFYTNEPTISAIVDRAQLEAEKSYITNMKKPCSELLNNQKRLVKIKKHLNKKMKSNPNILQEQYNLLESKFNTAPKKTDAFTRDDVLQKVAELMNDLSSIHKTNDELQDQIQIISKAKATLEMEKSGIEVAISVEKERLSKAQQRFNQLIGRNSELLEM
ncbi:hypothetical protein TRFO_02326 [Tritrichomonas foetus]|uniref:Uncharacterized protein n=1 Tax=Tritrichomonas foetus TaxID=1144522 RepID=A0A1J4J534_9EUKA|nr:hypothetical protein TRFO_02326 [Tritrichomonas foetus]|eukprot:OHS93809.1 hypothetical protein TRFO_02326 [Tritrichomonas foetus]